MSRIEIDIAQREIFAGGHAFGDAGAYERLRGQAHFRLAIDEKAKAEIIDIADAVGRSDGFVEFTADFLLLKPLDPLKGNRRLLYDCGNRGNMRSLQRPCRKGLSGRDLADSRGLLRPAWSPACGPRPPVDIIADERPAMRAI